MEEGFNFFGTTYEDEEHALAHLHIDSGIVLAMFLEQLHEDDCDLLNQAVQQFMFHRDYCHIEREETRRKLKEYARDFINDRLVPHLCKSGLTHYKVREWADEQCEMLAEME